ncbi:hypothetical protein [Dickeya fangzhongdai]|uniref:hypothetical protein n=1 Tax=Dickeya fangzhongdai TaxID=1778540 RepID=UPI00103E26EB|nr:hypothetical protein [Dickeya fangzhongdai]
MNMILALPDNLSLIWLHHLLRRRRSLIKTHFILWRIILIFKYTLGCLISAGREVLTIMGCALIIPSMRFQSAGENSIGR